MAETGTFSPAAVALYNVGAALRGEKPVGLDKKEVFDRTQAHFESIGTTVLIAFGRAGSPEKWSLGHISFAYRWQAEEWADRYLVKRSAIKAVRA